MREERREVNSLKSMIGAISMKQHFVPKTYLKGWADSNEKVWVYSKDNTLHRHANIKKVLWEEHLYSVTVDDALFLEESEIGRIFECLSHKTVLYDGKSLVTGSDFVSNWHVFDKWVITESDGQRACNVVLKATIEKTKLLTVEKGMQLLENDWNSVRDRVVQSVNSSSTTKFEMLPQDRRSLLQFIVVQQWRTRSTIQQYKDLVEPIMSLFKETLGTERYEDQLEEFSVVYFRKSIDAFQKSKAGHLSTELDLLEQLQLVFLKAPVQSTFLTSDNPVVIITDGSLDNGLYFPLTRHIVCAAFKGDPKKSIVCQVTASQVLALNEAVKINALDFFISADEILHK